LGLQKFKQSLCGIVISFLAETASVMADARKNKNGVKNSLVNNINARKKKGKSRPKKKSTVSKKAYSALNDNWGKKKASEGAKNKAAKKSRGKTSKRK
jgi:hypothetical protein